MFKAANQQLPCNIQGLFQRRESKHNLRGTYIFEKPAIRTNVKLHCVTAKGVSLWNNCQDELEKCKTLFKLKTLFRNKRLNGYELDQ